MRAAADGEDGSIKNVIMENRLYPLREMLAELLLEVGQPAAALKEYEAGLKQTPIATALSGVPHARPMRWATERRPLSILASS